MQTDRSLWVEDKYALRCRGCSEKFSMFRRRHHCRRCGQVFCYECLYTAQGAAGSQGIMGNVYDWFVTSPTKATLASPKSSQICSTPIPLASSVADEELQAELSTRLCHRCAATILGNAAREASTTRLDFRPSSNSVASLLLQSSFSPVSSPTVASAMYTPSRRPPPAALLDVSEASAATTPSLSRVEAREEGHCTFPSPLCREEDTAEEEDEEDDEDSEEVWKTARHEETAEERSVTYSIGPVQRRVPDSMAEWWTAHQSAMREKEQQKLSASGEHGAPLFSVGHTGARLHVLTDPFVFTAAFTPISTSFCVGSAAEHDSAELTDAEEDFVKAARAACTARLLLRLRSSVAAALPGTSPQPPYLSAHLAAIAWHVVQRTNVALGASMEEHCAFFSVPSAGLPPQCVVYPGLMCPQRLPSKREMTCCDNPRVLLLAGNLTYPVQPAEDLVDYVRSYSGYLDKLFQRLAVWNPDVIVVEGGMHHYLRERVEEHGQMRLLLHVGRDFLVRLSWCLHANIIADLQYVSMGDLTTTTPMGECLRFEVVELADEERFCGFSGFTSVSFHTLVFRGRSLCATAPRKAVKRAVNGAGDSAAPAAPKANVWNALVQLAREAVTAAYHTAMQVQWVLSLLRSAAPGSPFVDAVAAAVASRDADGGVITAALTMNGGCQFQRDIVAACRSAGASARLLRDTIVVNVVLMDYLFENHNGSSGNTNSNSNNAAAAVAAAGVAPRPALGIVTSLWGNKLANTTRGSDVFADSSPFVSHTSSPGASRTDLAGLGALLAAPFTPHTRGDTPAATSGAHAYAVVQQKVGLTFYGEGDDSLYIFLLSRCTAPAAQLLYLHGGHRVKVTVLPPAPRVSVPAPGSGANLNAAALAVLGDAQLLARAALEASQTVALHLAGMRQNAARTFAPGDAAEESVAISAGLTFLKGHFSLRVTSESAPAPGVAAAAPPKASPSAVDFAVPLCSPHLLNFSTAAFLEWVLYGWMPLLQSTAATAGAPTAAATQRLRLVFSFHPDVTVATGSPTPTALYRDTVTLLVDPVPVLCVEYPPNLLPSRPAVPLSLSEKGTTSDGWYAAHDANELEATLRGFYASLKSVVDGMAPDASSTPTTPDTPHHAEDGGRAAAAAAPLSALQPPPTLPATRSATLFYQLCDRAQLAVTALRESRMHGTADVALFLRTLRQQLIPTLMSDFRAWQAEARRAASREAPDAAAVSAVTDRGILRALEDCFYHPERVQWVRLGEPTSVLAAALELLYGAATVAASPASATPTPHHVRFTLSGDVSPVGYNERSSFAPPASGTAAASANLDESLFTTPSLTCAEALDVLRQCVRTDGSRPSSLFCRLRGYAPVLPTARGSGGGVSGGAGGGSNSLGGGAVSTVNALVEAGATSTSAIAGLGGSGGGGVSVGSNNSLHNSSNVSGGTSFSAAGELSFTVEVLFPHAFAALHVLYTNGAPLDFPAALLRCHPYTADGGKSQSRFFVTEDGRFLLKSVKPMELRYFKEWAPRYFARMADCYTPSATTSNSSPPNPFDPQSTLGKVLGLYVVHVQGSRVRPSSNTSLSDAALSHPSSSTPHPSSATLRHFLSDGTHCFMVAEQLLFQRPVREVWDLKGSQRNRKTEPTAAVRLDVDLVQDRLRHGDFLFCTPEAKSLLMDHLSCDTQLLSASGIMDYSLMASIGRTGNVDTNLYVGVIDFLHPYSSAKVLESKVKSSLDTVFGYGRRDPTIIDPTSYAARFMLWMDGYFNGVPDRLFPLTHVRLLAERKGNKGGKAQDKEV